MKTLAVGGVALVDGLRWFFLLTNPERLQFEFWWIGVTTLLTGLGVASVKSLVLGGTSTGAYWMWYVFRFFEPA